MHKLSYYKSYQPYTQILLSIIVNRLILQAEDILTEEHVGFRKNRSTTEHILNYRRIMEKHIDQQRQVYHNFIDYKKAFDIVWYEG